MAYFSTGVYGRFNPILFAALHTKRSNRLVLPTVDAESRYISPSRGPRPSAKGTNNGSTTSFARMDTFKAEDSSEHTQLLLVGNGVSPWICLLLVHPSLRVPSD